MNVHKKHKIDPNKIMEYARGASRLRDSHYGGDDISMGIFFHQCMGLSIKRTDQLVKDIIGNRRKS